MRGTRTWPSLHQIVIRICIDISHLVGKAGTELVASVRRSLLPEGKLWIATGEQLEVKLGQVWVERVEVEVQWVEQVVWQGDAKAEAGRPNLG